MKNFLRYTRNTETVKREREREKFFHVRQEIDPQECRYIIETTPNILIKKSNK